MGIYEWNQWDSLLDQTDGLSGAILLSHADDQNTGLNGISHAMQVAFFDPKEVSPCDPVAPLRHPRH